MVEMLVVGVARTRKVVSMSKAGKIDIRQLLLWIGESIAKGLNALKNQVRHHWKWTSEAIQYTQARWQTIFESKSSSGLLNPAHAMNKSRSLLPIIRFCA